MAKKLVVDDAVGGLLSGMISDFSVKNAAAWLERKFASFDTSRAKTLSLGENKNDKRFFASARILGFITELPESSGNDTNHPVLIAAVEMKNDLTERTSRQTQFNFAKRTLQEAVKSGAAGLNGYPSQGLFFFYDKDQFFRISLVSGNVEGRRFKFNEAKRQSFYINPDRPNNVAKSRLLEPIKTFSDLKDAFSVETLTKEFYTRLFDWYEWALKPKTGVTFPNDLDDDKDDKKYNNESIIRLITRLMFTWFIRQRGLVPDDYFTIDGVSSILKKFDPKSIDEDNYYRCILQNLFFATLNCQPQKRGFRKSSGNGSCKNDWGIKTLYRYEKEFRDPDGFKKTMKKVPFLNCALFDCLDKQEREQDGGRTLLFDGFSDTKKRQAHVPNGLFFHPEKGIVKLFDTYEFTIDENNADDADVALDPELLGKVFENLLGAFNPETSETARKSTGSFYTPREIVDYMVEESLKNHIKTKVPSMKDAWLDDLFDKTKAAEKESLPFGENLAAEVREALYGCKILDPACGSGAFPMGILHCMVRLFARLDPNNCDLNDRLIARYKLETNSPVDPLETTAEREERLAALKVQLAEGQHYPDYAQGELGYEMVDLNQPKRDEIDEQIRFAQKKIDSENAKSSAANVSAIDRLAEMVAGWDPYDQNATSKFFDPKWMFNIENGFDVVIGNPPYVQLQANKGELSRLYFGKGFETFDKTGDIYCLFYEKGNTLLEDGGCLCYITSNKWMRTGYGEKLRRYLLSKTRLLNIVDFAGKKIFESATVETNILISCKMKERVEKQAVKSCKFTAAISNNLTDEIKKRLSICEFDSGFWNIRSKLESAIQWKIESIGVPLREWDLRVFFGIKTGLNEAFLVDEETKQKLINADASSAKLLKPIVKGKDVSRYMLGNVTSWIVGAHNGYKDIPPINIKNYKSIYKRLHSFEPRLSERDDQGRTPYNLRDCAYWGEFKKEKIVWKRIGSILRFAYDDSGCMTLDSTCFATGAHIKFLVAVLNSRMGHYLLKDSPRTGTGDLLISVQAIEPIRIPIPSSSDEKPIIKLLDQILTAKKANPDIDTSALESEIDQLVYKLYGLTEEEIGIVEGRGEEGGKAKAESKPSRRAGKAASPATVNDDDEELE